MYTWPKDAQPSYSITHTCTYTHSQVLPVPIISTEPSESGGEAKSMETGEGNVSAGREGEGGEQDSGISLQIPSWKGPPMVSDCGLMIILFGGDSQNSSNTELLLVWVTTIYMYMYCSL